MAQRLDAHFAIERKKQLISDCEKAQNVEIDV